MRARLLHGERFAITLDRLCYELIENHNTFEETVLIGLQPRGIYLSKALHQRLESLLSGTKIQHGSLDTTFYRDDFRRRAEPLMPSSQDIPFIVEGKKVVLVDDVLYTGRTVRAALDALLAFGRPQIVELLVLVDRRYSRHLPIEPDYVGITVDSRATQRVKVEWTQTEGENNIWLTE